MLKALVNITEEMIEARTYCGEDSDCNECPCHIGTDDCVYNYDIEDVTRQEVSLRVTI